MLSDATRHRDFPSLSGISYLNTAAESIPPVAVGRALTEYFEHKTLGMRGRDHHFARLQACREVSARLLGLTPGEVSFCSCSSEAYNLLASAVDAGPDDEVIVTDLDFPAGATPWLTSPRRPVLKVWHHRDGVLHLDDLRPLLNPRTRLVQISLVSFYNGFRIDWKPFRDRVRSLAPQAIISVDITQAFGRVVLDCDDADVLISSTHKWTLGVHGGCVIGVPSASAERVTARAGGWFHLANAFEADRFERAEIRPGAPSFSVGMPPFAALYALDAALRYIEGVGVTAIAAHADPLVQLVHAGLADLGIKPMCPWQPGCPSGIVAFQHSRSTELHAVLERENIHVMHHAGRIRVAVHGYNTHDDIGELLRVLETLLRTV